jgi:hypothetical protein
LVGGKTVTDEEKAGLAFFNFVGWLDMLCIPFLDVEIF